MNDNLNTKNAIIHNFKQYLGKECPYCNGKIKRIIVDEEPTKQCENCGRILKKVNQRRVFWFIGLILVFLYEYYSASIEQSKILFGSLIKSYFVCVLVFEIAWDVFRYILGKHKIYK